MKINNADKTLKTNYKYLLNNAQHYVNELYLDQLHPYAANMLMHW